jgi:hypothetical protein
VNEKALAHWGVVAPKERKKIISLINRNYGTF